MPAPGSVSSSWLDSSGIGSGLHNPALTSTMQRQPEKTSRKHGADATDELSEPEDEFSGYVNLLTISSSCHVLLMPAFRYYQAFQWQKTALVVFKDKELNKGSTCVT